MQFKKFPQADGARKRRNAVCASARAGARARCVCAGGVFARPRVACEELDMSFRGIRHLKREQAKATELGIKHQATSARKHQPGAPPDLWRSFICLH